MLLAISIFVILASTAPDANGFQGSLSSTRLLLSRVNELNSVPLRNKCVTQTCRMLDGKYSDTKLNSLVDTASESATWTGNIVNLYEKYKVSATAWLGMIVLYTIAKPFLPAMACCFYFTVMGNSIVDILRTSYFNIIRFFEDKIPNWAKCVKDVSRKPFTALYAILLIAGIGRFCFYLFPRVMRESQYVVNIARSEDPYKLFVSFVTKTIGLDTIARVEKITTSFVDSKGLQFAGYIEQASVQPLEGLERRFGKLLQYYTTGYLNNIISLASRIISNSTSALCNAALGLLLSIMVIWDLPQLRRIVESLSKSRVGPLYDEVAPKISSFGSILARSFEVQFLIALCNCLLTTTGLILLKIPGVGFVSLLTLISSFIPVVGIFIATTPPLFIALTEFGLYKCFELIAMVVGVHAVEAYLLYPQIYSHKLKLHPLIVLVHSLHCIRTYHRHECHIPLMMVYQLYPIPSFLFLS